MVVIDTTTLLLLIDPAAKPPIDPATGKPLERCKPRLEHLVETLSKEANRVAIPTPVLAELLVGAGTAKNEYLAEIQGSSAFVILPFDVKSAVELSFLLEADGKPAKKRLTKQETWAKVKFDRQIVAIAKAGAIRDITDDTHLTDIAEANGIAVHHTWDLPLPPQRAQGELDLPIPKKPEDEEDEDDDGR